MAKAKATKKPKAKKPPKPRPVTRRSTPAPRADQPDIPGAEASEPNKKVDASARHYVDCRDARIKASAEEKASHDTLLGVMVEQGLTRYRYRDVLVDIDTARKCKVKIGEQQALANGEAAEEN